MVHEANLPVIAIVSQSHLWANVADLPVVPRVLPYLKLLFKDEMIVDELDDVSAVSAFS